MEGPGLQAPLRPLGLGELLDRAVTLCVKQFVPLALIYAVYAAPLTVVQFFATDRMARAMHDLTATITAAGGKADPRLLAHALGAIGLNGWYWLSFGLSFFIAPLAWAALIEAVSATYLGRPTSFGDAYRVALRRWPTLIGLNFLFALCLLVVYVALVLVVFVVVLGITFLTATMTAALRGVGIGLATILGLAALASMVAFFVVGALAFEVSYFTAVVEVAGAVTSFRRALGRVFVGVGLKRSLWFGLVFLAIGIGITLVAGAGQSVLFALVRSSLPGTVYVSLIGIATVGFQTAFIGIFYFDLRVREEGFDLTLAAQNARQQLRPST